MPGPVVCWDCTSAVGWVGVRAVHIQLCHGGGSGKSCLVSMLTLNLPPNLGNRGWELGCGGPGRWVWLGQWGVYSGQGCRDPVSCQGGRVLCTQLPDLSPNRRNGMKETSERRGSGAGPG